MAFGTLRTMTLILVFNLCISAKERSVYSYLNDTMLNSILDSDFNPTINKESGKTNFVVNKRSIENNTDVFKSIADFTEPNKTQVFDKNKTITEAEYGRIVDTELADYGLNVTEEPCVGDPEFCNMTQEEYLEMLNDYIFPQPYEWVLIATHAIVFVIGLIGNALVCIAVYRNHSMRTVTNYFIVNLAVADFMVILICLPPTVLWDVTETWFFGTAMCRIVLYFQVSLNFIFIKFK